MTFEELISLNEWKEEDRLSGDNHVFHFGSLNGKEVEIDEDLETMRIEINGSW